MTDLELHHMGVEVDDSPEAEMIHELIQSQCKQLGIRHPELMWMTAIETENGHAVFPWIVEECSSLLVRKEIEKKKAELEEAPDELYAKFYREQIELLEDCLKLYMP